MIWTTPLQRTTLVQFMLHCITIKSFFFPTFFFFFFLVLKLFQLSLSPPPQDAVPAVVTMWLVTAVAVLPWSRCSTWSVSHASPATPISEGNLFTPWIKRVTVKVVTLWVTGQAYGQVFSLQLSFKCLHLFQSTLERCSKCSKPILDRILRAMGKAYHPRCFTCVVCNCCLDGVPFTVDATSQIHCIEDFHRYDHISTPLHKHFFTFCNILFFFFFPPPWQEVCTSLFSVWRAHHAGAGSGGDGQDSRSGSQLPCELLRLWGENEARTSFIPRAEYGVALNWLECVSTRNAGSCCPPRGRAEAVTHWTATSCARAAALGASRTCRPKSPLTADLKTPLQNITLCCAASCRSVASLILVRERCLSQIRSQLTSNLVSFHSETQTFPFCSSFSPDLQAAWAPCSI